MSPFTSLGFLSLPRDRKVNSLSLFRTLPAPSSFRNICVPWAWLGVVTSCPEGSQLSIAQGLAKISVNYQTLVN